MNQINELVQRYIDATHNKMETMLCLGAQKYNSIGREVIQKYTAAFAVNFTDWMGKTSPWVRHELARYALVDNLRCEQMEDHASMLYRFAEACGAFPGALAMRRMAAETAEIRYGFCSPERAGLYGLGLLTILETASIDFIPVLKDIAIDLGCTGADLRYVEIHGEADKRHSDQFAHALEAELSMSPLEEAELRIRILDPVWTRTMTLLGEIF